MKALRWTLPLALVACGGGSGPGTGQMQLQITDAPVDGADNVFIQFTGIEVQGQNGSRTLFPFDPPKTFDLLALQNGKAAILQQPVTLPAGNYSWLRLMVNAEFDGGASFSCIDPGADPDSKADDTVTDSCIIINGAQHDLWVPSGAESGLKLPGGFAVPEGGLVNFTIDFDLRHSIVAPPGQQPGYMLKPVLRMVSTVGGVAGNVAAGVITAECSTAQIAGSDFGAVYIYSGGGVTPDDVDGDSGDPLTTVDVVKNLDGSYSYTAAFLSPGTYTVSYTCDASSETTSNGTLGDDFPAVAPASFDFFGTADVAVLANQITRYDFVLPPP